jgi:hypothetical protein
LAIIANPGLLLKDVEGSSSDNSESSSPEERSSSHREPESLSSSVIDVDTDMDVDVNRVKCRVDAEERYGGHQTKKSHGTISKFPNNLNESFHPFD